jgi:hypothetical protein
VSTKQLDTERAISYIRAMQKAIAKHLADIRQLHEDIRAVRTKYHIDGVVL